MKVLNQVDGNDYTIINGDCVEVVSGLPTVLKLVHIQQL